MRTRHYKRVPHVRQRLEKSVLGKEITFHSPAVRRKKQRGVYDMSVIHGRYDMHRNQLFTRTGYLHDGFEMTSTVKLTSLRGVHFLRANVVAAPGLVGVHRESEH